MALFGGWRGGILCVQVAEQWCTLCGFISCVTLNAVKPGYNTVTKNSSQTVSVVIGVWTSALPTVDENAQVDKVLTAAPGIWTTGIAFTYQWLGDGTAITGATQTS